MTFLHLNICFIVMHFRPNVFFLHIIPLKRGFNDDIINHKITNILFDNPTNSLHFVQVF